MRKIIQIQTATRDNGVHRLYALTDDGLIWVKRSVGVEHEWEKVDTEEIHNDRD
jgi:hypothetical protein